MSKRTQGACGGVGLIVMGLNALGVMALIFMGLKFLEQITWSWWWVTAPLWGPVALLLAVVALWGCVHVAYRIVRWWGYG